mmetsp:Transcript_76314/g.223760  ORF Transcript_76314/g.223760 Transcript_76314/m.223760 type:complete len:235 (+) Transcript_76314:2128-2832(+)
MLTTTSIARACRPERCIQRPPQTPHPMLSRCSCCSVPPPHANLAAVSCVRSPQADPCLLHVAIQRAHHLRDRAPAAPGPCNGTPLPAPRQWQRPSAWAPRMPEPRSPAMHPQTSQAPSSIWLDSRGSLLPELQSQAQLHQHRSAEPGLRRTTALPPCGFYGGPRRHCLAPEGLARPRTAPPRSAARLEDRSAEGARPSRPRRRPRWTAGRTLRRCRRRQRPGPPQGASRPGGGC